VSAYVHEVDLKVEHPTEVLQVPKNKQDLQGQAVKERPALLSTWQTPSDKRRAGGDRASRAGQGMDSLILSP
jgi:hypothetical protein